MTEIEIKEEEGFKASSNKSLDASASRQQVWYLKDYCSKIIHISQMDIEYNFAQLFYSLFAPSKLYQHTKWRKRIIYENYRNKKLLG